MLRNATHTAEANSTAEAKDMIEAADTLDLKVRCVRVKGKWKFDDDLAVNSRADVQIHKIGRKWFHLNVDGEIVKGRPTTSSLDHLDRGSLKFVFDRDA